ncbi:hypothetical protein ACWEVP_46330 [Amycolatopsis sp. NPDC003865]
MSFVTLAPEPGWRSVTGRRSSPSSFPTLSALRLLGVPDTASTAALREPFCADRSSQFVIEVRGW